MRFAARSIMLSVFESSCFARSLFFAIKASRIVFVAAFIFRRHMSFTARRRAFVRRAFFPADSCGINRSIAKRGNNVNSGARLGILAYVGAGL